MGGAALFHFWSRWAAPKIPDDGKPEGVSIIVPTLNEEKALPLLLDSIVRQRVSSPVEVIVVDGGKKGPSEDATIDVALSYAAKGLDVKVVIGDGLPAKARNIGAAEAQYKHLFFLDADVELIADDHLAKMLEEARRSDVAFGVFYQVPRSKEVGWDIHLWYAGANLVYRTIQPCCAAHLYARRSAFFQVGCFRDDLGLGDDHEFGERCRAAGLGMHIFPLTVIWDERRLTKEGVVGMGLKYGMNALYNAGEKLGLGTRTDQADPHYFDRPVREGAPPTEEAKEPAPTARVRVDWGTLPE